MSTRSIERPLPGTVFDPLYPESDGEPLGETGIHAFIILGLFSALRRHLKERMRAHVATNMFVYYEEGNPKAVRAPDVMVIKGVDDYLRRTFKVWEEGTVPTVVFEITSLKTKSEDVGPKQAVYAAMGIQELFLFDPLGEYLRPPLQGFRLQGGRYVSMSGDEIVSDELGIRMAVDGSQMLLFDQSTGEPILTDWDYADRQWELRVEAEKLAAEAEKQRADVERQKEAAEAEVARLRALLEQRESRSEPEE